MEHIIVDFQPFVAEQHIMVYQNGACVEQQYVNYDEVINYIIALSNKYNIENIDLCGNTDFLKKWKNDLQTNTSFTYGKDLKITIINK